MKRKNGRKREKGKKRKKEEKVGKKEEKIGKKEEKREKRIKGRKKTKGRFKVLSNIIQYTTLSSLKLNVKDAHWHCIHLLGLSSIESIVQTEAGFLNQPSQVKILVLTKNTCYGCFHKFMSII